MSAISKTLKTAAAAAAVTLGAGAIVNECVLNIRFSRKMGEKLGFVDEENEKLYEQDYPVFCAEWLAKKKPEDSVIEKNGVRYHAYILMNDKKSDKWAVINHGFTSVPLDMSVYAYEYMKRGFNCILPSMRGHGEDEGKYCSMGYYDKDIVKAWIEYIVLLNPKAQIVLHGVSMGAATTMLTTGESLPENVKAAVSDCGYTSCYKEFSYAAKEYMHLPAFPLIDAANAVSKMKGNFDFKKAAPIDAVMRSTTPTLFIHGDHDDFVPYYMLDEVYSACAAPKKKLVIEGARHAISVIVDPEKYWDEVEDFIEDYIK